YITASSFWQALQHQDIPTDPKAQQAFQQRYHDSKTRFEDAERRLAALRSQLSLRYTAFRHLQGTEPPSPTTLHQLARQHPDTLFLEYAIVNKQTTLLFAFSARTGCRAFSLYVGDEVLTRQVQQWRTALSQRQPDELSDARRLYRELLG